VSCSPPILSRGRKKKKKEEKERKKSGPPFVKNVFASLFTYLIALIGKQG